MRFAYEIQNRKARAWVIVIILAISAILIAADVLQSHRSPKPFEMDDLYGLLD